MVHTPASYDVYAYYIHYIYILIYCILHDDNYHDGWLYVSYFAIPLLFLWTIYDSSYDGAMSCYVTKAFSLSTNHST
jgi:hypothetical protein